MRFMIGLFEAGLVPGSIFLLSAYYARFDLQWRLNMLLVGNGVASAFGGVSPPAPLINLQSTDE